ncbi:uncharacterized protein BDW70DRAFT_132091 [Aspergillus foveolatus]|uniref:uncharacterized protein n=1 Tax=Aspergillus foveolatus TaxID=210207 RepID=UPI003CCDF15A
MAGYLLRFSYAGRRHLNWVAFRNVTSFAWLLLLLRLMSFEVRPRLVSAWISLS